MKTETEKHPRRQAPTTSLHDCISLGEIEAGLSTEASVEELHRLPILLRILSSARPLAAIPKFSIVDKEKMDTEKEDGQHQKKEDDLLNEAVRRLEGRAASFSVAEGVEVVSCHLAPAMCRNISKLRPLQKKSKNQYDTDSLAQVAAGPLQAGGLSSKRRKTEATSEKQVTDDDEDDLHDPMELDNDDQLGEAELVGDSKKRHRSEKHADSSRLSWQSQDSQEANIARTLTELTSLVVQSLKPPKKEEEEGGELSTIDWSISMEDSILAEVRQKNKTVVENVGGAMVGSDLGANIVALLHHAPVLRHDHVAVSLKDYNAFSVCTCSSFSLMISCRLHCAEQPSPKQRTLSHEWERMHRHLFPRW